MLNKLKSMPSYKMTEEEKWEALIRSINKAAHILGKELTEKDVPEYLNWRVGTEMNHRLWSEVYARNKDKFQTRFEYELKKRGW